MIGVKQSAQSSPNAASSARDTGRNAKTDPVDAAMLAELGQRLPPRTEPPAETVHAHPPPCRVAMRTQERTRPAREADPMIAADRDDHLAQLDGRIAAFDRAVAEMMRAGATLAHHAARLRSAPGRWA